jgi:HD-GYP domain-containing protein (c-di-GMP phosphodiesterase class II)
LHPYHSERILSRCPALAPIARTAGMHHERQDGSGYYRQARRSAIPPAARILAAADVYQAMTQQRPHRPAWTVDRAAAELHRMSQDGQLDPDAVTAVLATTGQKHKRAWPAGLSDREVEVLRLVAKGLSNRAIGSTMGISPRTAEHHVQNLYAKVGFSTRAAAALYAMETTSYR